MQKSSLSSFLKAKIAVPSRVSVLITSAGRLRERLGPFAFLDAAQNLIRQRTCEYRSAHVWAKPDLGTGYWVRDNVELPLIATRGMFERQRRGSL
jgi:hypothetical protein